MDLIILPEQVTSITMKNGRLATQAVCTYSGTKKFRIQAVYSAWVCPNWLTATLTWAAPLAEPTLATR